MSVQPTASFARFPAEYGQTSDMQMILQDWSEVEERIARSPNYFLATVTPHHKPYLRPVDGVFVNNTLMVGGSFETRWVKNLAVQNEVTVSLPDDDFAVIIEGSATLIDDADHPYIAPMDRQNRAKYPQYFTEEEDGGFHPVWAISPLRVFAWKLSEFPARATKFSFESDSKSGT